MEQIAILLPRQTILKYAQNVLKKENTEVQILKVVENSNAAAEAKEAIDAGARVIIARGLQATLIKESLNIPVVEMPITVREIGFMILKAKKMLKKDHPSIGIVAFENMFESLADLDDLFDFELHFYKLNELDETRNLVSQAIIDGVDLIIGGVKTNQIAFEIGFPSLFMETGEESIKKALQMAVHMLELAELEKHNKAQLDTLLDTSFSGIIKINAYQEIVAVNRVIEQLLGKPNSEVIGFPIDKVFDGIDAESIEGILSGREELYSTSFSIKNQLLMVIGAPIQYDGHYSGAILTCHKVRTTEREEVSEQGVKLAGSHLAGHNFHHIRRESGEMKRCIKLARAYGISKNPVFIYGETGTEIEIFAEAIHNNSPQRGGPFIRINCSTLTQEEQKRVLFGFGEENRKKSGCALETAASGTVFLEEVDRLSSECQYLLFKAVRDRLFWDHDSMVKRVLPVRLIAASNKELAVLVKQGIFREDLYFFLSSLKISLPPLRKEPEEIRRFTGMYLEKYNTAYSRFVEISEDALRVMEEYFWEGNILQLESFCERLVLTAHRRKVEEGMVKSLLQELYPVIREENGTAQIVKTQNPEALRIERLMEQYNGRRTEVAEAMKISTTTLWRKMKRYGIGDNYDL
ncbi:PrpR N-terminal domain-containing protein [Clostridium boliviensis]|uniref:PrpR N-terminal domain-containing protein n=1 Tax=Clostridium boliviensis TaxID=318465 RepID=A0ABU4GQL5_9CLOT|nr:PrpR N-terminal domain-containing protein [Clostridium boliviensis]MDW2799282.1 PrpR N-terminal domain-containing protein [Clostridium boliviensis]